MLRKCTECGHTWYCGNNGNKCSCIERCIVCYLKLYPSTKDGKSINKLLRSECFRRDKQYYYLSLI